MIQQNTKRHKLASDEVKQIAQKLVKESLANYVIPPEIRENLVLGEGMEGDWKVFDLYVPGETYEDANIICTSKINVYTGEALISIFLDTPGDSAS
jgi:hypothetical protein